MVKNAGGNRAKKQGSKYQNTDFRKTTRFSKHPDEIYAAVIKEYGGGRALIKCVDGEERILIIRNKFKGKSKRQNYIKAGVWVLAGKREWECLKASAKENCDLLEVYTQEDARFLRNNVTASWEMLSGIGSVCEEQDQPESNPDYDNYFSDEEQQEKNDTYLSVNDIGISDSDVEDDDDIDRI